MVNNNSTNPSLWSNFRRKIKQIIKDLLKSSRTRTSKRILEKIQLTFIYFFASVVLSYSIQGVLGGFPEFIFYIFPDFEEMLTNPLLQLLATPEKTFLLYLLLIEVILNKSRFNFSLLVKYNILLIFILEMVQNLVMSYYDLFINREIEYAFFDAQEIWVEDLAFFFFTLMYLFTLGTYLYCYLRSMSGRFPIFPGPTRFLTESVAFWLRIKVSPEGRKKKEK